MQWLLFLAFLFNWTISHRQDEIALLSADGAAHFVLSRTINFAEPAWRRIRRKYRAALFLVYLEVVDGLAKIFVRVPFHGLRGDWTHVVVHYCEFHERQEDEHAARRHPYVDRLHIRDRR